MASWIWWLVGAIIVLFLFFLVFLPLAQNAAGT